MCYLSKIVVLCSSVLVISITVESYILRLPCKKEADFLIAINNKFLLNSIIGRHEVPNVERCTEECVANDACESMNYIEFGKNNCRLHSKIKENSEKSNFITSAGWTYIATDRNTKKIGSQCNTKNPCKPGSYCVDWCSFPYYKCIECGPNYQFQLDYKTFCKLKGNL